MVRLSYWDWIWKPYLKHGVAQIALENRCFGQCTLEHYSPSKFYTIQQNFALETRSKVDEANVDTFNHVESSNGWIRALEAWACKQLRNKTKEFETVEIIYSWGRCWSSLWNQRFSSSQSSVIGGTLSSSIIVEVDNVIVDSTWVICQWNPNLRPVLTISCL